MEKEVEERVATWKEIESLVLKETDYWTKKMSIEESPEGYLCQSIKIIYKEQFGQAITKPGRQHLLVIEPLSPEEIRQIDQFMILFQAFHHRDYTFAESLFAACETYIPIYGVNETNHCMLVLAKMLPGASITIDTLAGQRFVDPGRAWDRKGEGMPTLGAKHPAVRLLVDALMHEPIA